MDEALLRSLTPSVLTVLVRRGADFAAAEDAVQDALVEAVRVWPTDPPRDAKGWLVTVAWRKFLDAARADTARRRREDLVDEEPAPGPAPAVDDTLQLYFLCAHPSLTPSSAVALTLRAVGGLTTRQIAQAYLVPEATMAQRISRAKQTIKAGGLSLAPPEGEDRTARLAEVRHVLYLVFNEGYTASGGDALTAPELSTEAIRLVRMLHRLVPEDTETAGLLALMLLTDARRPARTGPDGELVPLAEQDRGSWDGGLIAEGVELLGRTLPEGRVGPYQLQAAIAAVHDEAPSAEATDWPQILALYELLERTGPNPMVTLNRAVAVAMVHGPEAGLELLDGLAEDGRLARNHRLLATRAHLLELLGEKEDAASAYREAARHTTSAPERRHLTERARRLG